MLKSERELQAPVTTFCLGSRPFTFAGRLCPLVDEAGALLLDHPEHRYEKRTSTPLHRYGGGPFCSFRIATPARRQGVYLLVVDSTVQYIGECADLGRRFNSGYGQISPRNCYRGGRSTNCKINRQVLQESMAGNAIHVYFLETPDYKAVERELLHSIMPPWNGRR